MSRTGRSEASLTLRAASGDEYSVVGNFGKRPTCENQTADNVFLDCGTC